MLAQTGTPTPETVDGAYRSLIEFGVVGAVLAIIIAALLGIVWWSLLTGRKRENEHLTTTKTKDDEHKEAVATLTDEHRAAMTTIIHDHRKSKDEQSKAHQTERLELIAAYQLRIESYIEVLREKDALIDKIQEKRVELVTTSVEAISKQSNKMEQLLKALSEDG